MNSNSKKDFQEKENKPVLQEKENKPVPQEEVPQEEVLREEVLREEVLQEEENKLVLQEEVKKEIENNKFIKEEFFKRINEFINQLDISIDYISGALIKKIKKYVNVIKNDDLRFFKFIEYNTKHIGKFSIQIYTSMNKKVRSNFYDFMNEMYFFGEDEGACLLKFEIFKDESKNTKKDLLKYLYNFYISSNLLNLDLNNDEIDFSIFENFLNEMKHEGQEKKGDKKNNKKVRRQKNVNVNPMNDIFSSIFDNPEMMNLTTDILKEMETGDINPMMLLNSLMTGGHNTQIMNLAEKIENKISDKMSSGEFNKDDFEHQAKNILSSLSKNMNNIPQLSGLGLDKILSNLKL
jgi:hypothetical protein